MSLLTALVSSSHEDDVRFPDTFLWSAKDKFDTRLVDSFPSPAKNGTGARLTGSFVMSAIKEFDPREVE